MLKIISWGASICTAAIIITIFYKKRYRRIPKKTILDYIGNTPLIYISSLSKATGCEIYAKAEFMNPFGSSKDRAAKFIIADAQKKGYFKIHRQIIEASSGSTAISLNHVSNILRLTCKLYLPNDLSQQKYKLLQILGAQIVKVPPVSFVDNNHFVNLAQQYAATQNVCYANQFQNLANMRGHYTTTGPQIYQQTYGLLDAFVCSAGTGGTLAGVSKYLKKQKPNVKIILADPEGSGLYSKVKFGTFYSSKQKQGYFKKNPFYSITQGIGLNRNTQNFTNAIIDNAYKVSDLEALHMSRYLIKNEGLFLGSSSAVNLVATVKFALQHKDLKIVTVLHDNGNRYLSKFYNEKYLEQKGIKFVAKQFYAPEDLSFVNKK